MQAGRLQRIPGRQRVLGVLVVLLSLVAGYTALPSDAGTRASAAAPPRIGWQSGAYSGVTALEHQLFADWRGRKNQTILVFQGSGSWHEMSNADYLGQQYRSNPARLIISSALWPQSLESGSLARAARGDYNGHFRNFAKSLVANGLGRSTIRLGWEMNGSWYDWAIRDRAGALRFAQAFRRIVAIMRTVPGQQLTFDWAPVATRGGVDPALAYPGNGYVDFVGLDVYNFNFEVGKTGSVQRWNVLKTMKYGLDWHVRFAKARNKRLSYPEWALVSIPGSQHRVGGDDPRFIRNMFRHFQAHRPAYENYFDTDVVNGPKYGINTGNGRFPAATRAYLELWGGKR